MIKRLITLPLVTLLALVGLWLAGAVAASGAATAQASCRPNVAVSHSSYAVTADIDGSCGMRIAAYGNAWQTGYRVGRFKGSGDSVACVNSACTEGGGWANGGWERLGGHVEHCTFGCSHSGPPAAPVIRTMALAHKCTSTYDFGLGLHNDENGGQADWETNGCHYTMQTRVECRNNISGADYYVYSGEVHGLEIDDWAACNFPDFVADFWIDPHDTNHWLDV